MRRNKPKPPRVIYADHDVTETMALPQNASVRIDAEERKKNIERARREDAFDQLKQGMAPGAYDAVRDLEALLIRRVGGDTRSDERVQGGGEPGVAAHSRALAGIQADQMLARVGDRDRWLLLWLLDPESEGRLRFGTWREVVHHITGEVNPVAQAAAVRSAAANLVVRSEQRTAA